MTMTEAELQQLPYYWEEDLQRQELVAHLHQHTIYRQDRLLIVPRPYIQTRQEQHWQEPTTIQQVLYIDTGTGHRSPVVDYVTFKKLITINNNQYELRI